MTPSWKVMVAAALVLASLSIALGAFLYDRGNESARAGCERQNDIRQGLNRLLDRFEIKGARFVIVNCERAYDLTPPP